MRNNLNTTATKYPPTRIKKEIFPKNKNNKRVPGGA
jgi:hypothetical protein